MLRVIIPPNNCKERAYIVNIICNEFLGVEYTLEVGTNDCEIILSNSKKLIFNDAFFSQHQKELEYLKLENIPNKIQYINNQFINKEGVPVIFGNSKLEVSDLEIICGIDIFASCFFMLTRWEEYVNKNRDIHNRFAATDSLAFKNNFLDRPVVNEYIEMLKNMLFYLDDGIKFKEKKSQLFLTHDVDELYMWKNWKHVARVAIGDLLKRKSVSLATSRFIEYKNIKQGKARDPFDTFDWLMDKSESIDVKSRFYFMSGGVTKYDNRYSISEPKCLNLINTIKQRGHIIGFHPSYNAYDNHDQFKREKELLEKTVGKKITEGREHFLRFEVPTTWQVWEDNNMKVDSTCGYADKEGFRCGTGDKFSVFNILTRKQLALKEQPLIFMDDNHYSYNKVIDTNKSFDVINSLINVSKTDNMTSTILFHNSIFNTDGRVDFRELYIKLLST